MLTKNIETSAGRVSDFQYEPGKTMADCSAKYLQLDRGHGIRDNDGRAELIRGAVSGSERSGNFGRGTCKGPVGKLTHVAESRASDC